MSDTVINGYVLENELTTKNAGFAKWGFATKNGKRYFIKEFLSPVFPVDESMFSPRMLEATKKGCEVFQGEKAGLYGAINRATDGNIVCIQEFFRSGGKYYITMEKIRSIEYNPVPEFPIRNKILLCLLLTHSIVELHKQGVVHADLKWDNILFTLSDDKSKFVTKLIDFDNSFIIGKTPPDHVTFQIDEVYCAPEGYMFSCDADGFDTVDEKIDIFALGLIIHKLMCNELPKYDPSCKYAYEAAMDNKSITLNYSLDERLKSLIVRMLAGKPGDRPSAAEVYNELADIADWDVVKYPDTVKVAEKTEESPVTKETKSEVSNNTEGKTVVEEKLKEEPVKTVETTPVTPVARSSKLKINSLNVSAEFSYDKVIRTGVTETTHGIERRSTGADYFSTAGDL